MSKKILLIIFLLLALIFSLTLVFRTTILTNRAVFYTDKNPVLKNSYLFASPLQAKAAEQSLPADRREKIRITVFILDNQGLGIANQIVSINPQPNLIIENIQSTTTDTGQAVFNISSTTPGKYIIQAQLGSQQIPQSISLTFY